MKPLVQFINNSSLQRCEPNHSNFCYSGLDEKILCDCMKLLESHLDKPEGLKAFEKFYSANGLYHDKVVCFNPYNAGNKLTSFC